MAASATALWGINYTLSYQHGKVIYKQKEQTGSGRWVTEYYSYYVDNFLPVANFSGNGELVTASYDRYVYQVPEGQVLVLNQLEGKGSVFINGYGVSVSDGVLPIQYVFGAGELVTIKFSPAFKSQSVYEAPSKKATRIATDVYHPMNISGFTAEPSVFASMGMVAGK